MRVPVPKWGPSTATDYGMAAINRRGPDELSHLLTSHLVLCTFTACSGRETRLAGSRIRTVTAGPGSCEIVPAGSDYWARWHHHKQVAVFSLDSKWLDTLGSQEFGISKMELAADALPFASDRIKQLALLLRSELEQSRCAPSQLYADSLLTLLGMELVRNHSSPGKRLERHLWRMSPKAIDNVVQYMRSEIANAVSLQKLASVAGYSAGHFLKCFKAETGQTPHRFLLNLRLDAAQELLRSTTLTITEIAASTGFSGQAHLTAAMRKERFVTPGVFRRDQSRNH